MAAPTAAGPPSPSTLSTVPAKPSTMTSQAPSQSSSQLPQPDGKPADPLSNALLRGRIPKLEPRRRQAPQANPTPVPDTPALPPPTAGADKTSTHSFSIPHRRILTPHDHELFLASSTCTLLQAWVFGLADSVVDVPAGVFADVLEKERKGRLGDFGASGTANPRFQKTPQRAVSPVIHGLLGILDEAEQLVLAHPPDEAGGSRFGNKRFRDFVDDVRRSAPGWHTKYLGIQEAAGDGTNIAADPSSTPATPSVDAVSEVSTYLAQSFGNRARIDYGSGHELHFVVWLLCLYQLGLVTASDQSALVLCVLTRYLEVMRLIQTTYYLEPAGSHGVWGLDDYQFLPFLFGSAQLLHHRYITPRAVHQPLTLEQFGDDYLYLGQVRFVNSIKVATGGVADDSSSNSLRWHSPMLDDISAAKSWSKIEGGMRRMFLAEVLKKLPVMQHFLFGSLVPAAEGMTEPPMDATTGLPVNEEEEEDAVADGDDAVDVYEDAGGQRHIHNPSGWGDCCGIRVPSSLGAAGEMRKHGAGDVFRRIPFD